MIYTPASLDEGRGEVVVQASTSLSRFCRRLRPYLRPVAYVRVRGGVDAGLSLFLARPSFLLSTLFVHPHPSTTMGGRARFEVGWAARVQVDCPGRRFGVRGWFSSVSASVRIRIHVFWQSTWLRDRWGGLMALGGASTPD